MHPEDESSDRSEATTHAPAEPAEDSGSERNSWLDVPDPAELPEDVSRLFGKAEEKIDHVPNVLRAFALDLTVRSQEMSEADLEPQRAQGLDDATIFEAAQVAAMFNFTNTLANGLGWKPNRRYDFDHRP